MRDVIETIRLQEMLFSDEATSGKLLAYRPKCSAEYKVQVFRNHSFEIVEHMLGAYLDYAAMGVRFLYGGYDDSFSFQEFFGEADLYLLWIDGTRYTQTEDDKRIFLEGRIKYLRSLTDRPILLIPYEISYSRAETDVTVMDLQPIIEIIGEGFLDLRAWRATGTPFGRRALGLIAEKLGTKYLPGLLKPPVKAIVTDLDNTLYDGVLGEDGSSGIKMTDGHRKLQTWLKEKSKEGIFLCAVSKNEPEDVRQLFEKRTDFPLCAADFTKMQISWDEKAASIRTIAEYLNIGTDSMLFIDDNIGELSAVAALLPEIHEIHAKEEADKTLRVLSHYPGIAWRREETDRIDRKEDARANEKRRELQRRYSGKDYIRQMGITLTYSYNVSKQAQRISELAGKTNQFIFTYRRYSVTEIERMMRAMDVVVAAVSLSDRLTDSGLIGVCVGRNENDFVRIEEVFVSCRALGRGIEEIIVLGAIKGILDRCGTDMLRVDFTDGPRNAPARDFYDKQLKSYGEKEAHFHYEIPKGLVNVQIEWESEGNGNG